MVGTPNMVEELEQKSRKLRGIWFLKNCDTALHEFGKTPKSSKPIENLARFNQHFLTQIAFQPHEP